MIPRVGEELDARVSNPDLPFNPNNMRIHEFRVIFAVWLK